MKKVENTQKLSVKQRLKFLIKGEIPTGQKTTGWRRHGDRPESNLEYLDVDGLWDAIKHAERGQTDDLFAIYRDVIANDSHIQAEFSKRKIAVLGDTLNISEATEDDDLDKAAATSIEKMLHNIKGWERFLAHLMDSVLFPVAVAEKVFRPSQEPGVNYEIAELVAVEHDLLDYTTGRLMIRDTDKETGTRLQTFHEPDPKRYIIHRGHLLSLPDQWGGPMRSILFWCLLSTMDRTWWANFLDKYGTPFPVGKYDQNDDNSRGILMTAFSTAKKVGGLVVSKDTEVELIEAAKSDSGDAYEKFLSICQREKSKLILGQTLSAEAQPTGLGSGVAKGQSDVREDIRKFDSVLLGSTLKDQLFGQLMQINNMQGNCPTAVWGSDTTEELQAVGELIQHLKTGGLIITDEGIHTLNKRLGFSVQRSAEIPATPVNPLSSIKVLSSDPDDLIVENSSADLAQAFRGDLAPVRQLIRNSESPDKLEQALRSLFSDW